MEWNKLINCTRLGCEGVQEHDNRNSYNRDYDRIIFSKEFRQLQSKTQVVPFPERDATHTRLTHSLETASVGRSLGNMAASKLSLSENYKLDPNDIGAAVSAACLCHDIGNPPLGHSGEAAISQYFKDSRGSSLMDKYITKDQRFDFERFEGNAIGFNLLTASDPCKTKAHGGFGLTYTTLAAFSKYPNRLTSLKSESQSASAYLNKPGLLKCDVMTFKSIATELGLNYYGNNCWCRHPLAYLTEAADDICYAIVDLEDGYKNKSISYDDTHELLQELIRQDPETKLNTDTITDKDEIIGYLRAKAINALINLSINTFVNYEKEIMQGSFNSTLIKTISSSAFTAYKQIKKAEAEKVYSDKSILLTEAAGFIVLPGLLDILISAAFEESSRSEKIRDCLIRDMICRDVFLDEENQNYQTLVNIVKYVALMTDNYAVKLYRELTGIQLPNY